MPTPKEVATELRHFADLIEASPAKKMFKLQIDTYNFFGDTAKTKFIEFAKMMPRPVEKIYTDDYLKLKYNTDSLQISAEVARNLVCEIVTPAQPAKYNCEPLLSEDEDSKLIEAE